MPEPMLRERWQPLRGGLINLFKYEDQVFHYSNGHLLLRGNNGSGKSRVLALQLPFLFDGEIIPSRVEPDRDPAKRMEWHLLMDQHERRTGYTWLEFARRDQDGTEHHLTLGCGLEARKGGGAPKRWFFITPERIGTDLQLLANRVPLGKAQLNAVFQSREQGTLYEKAGDYRTAVDQALFKLGPQRYAALLDLLIQLRQPQLMRDMKEDVLSNALSEALPPVRSELVNQVAESFQSLESDRQHTEEHREMRDTVEAFRDGYRQYLSVAARRLCGVVRLDHSQFERATKELRGIEKSLEANQQLLEHSRRDQAGAETLLARHRSEIETLRSSPEMRSAQELDRVKQLADELTREEERLAEDLSSARNQLDQINAELKERTEHAGQVEADLNDLHRSLADHHSIICPTQSLLPWRETDLPAQRSKTEALVLKRRRCVAHIEQLNRALDTLAHKVHEAQARAEDQAQDVKDSQDDLHRNAGSFQEAITRFGVSILQWEATLSVLHPEAFPRGQEWSTALSEWCLLPDERPTFPFTESLRKGQNAVHKELAQAEAELSRQMREAAAERIELEAELLQLQQGRQLEPPLGHTRSAQREGRPGAPFWKLFEFQSDIPGSEHASWEAALESAGFLDAWIYPDGTLAEIPFGDAALFSTSLPELEPSTSLASILKSIDANPALGKLLHLIGNHPDSASCWIASDGRWANGPHTGHWHKENAEYLGHTAREAARQRRISELQSRLDEVGQRIASAQQELTRLRELISQLEAEVARSPSLATVESLLARQSNLEDTLTRQKQRLLEARERARKTQDELTSRSSQRDQDAADMHLTDWRTPEKLQDYRSTLDAYERTALELWPRWDNHHTALRELQATRARQATAQATTEDTAARHHEKQLRAGEARAKEQALQENIGATVQEVMQRLARAEQAQAETQTSLRGAQNTLRHAEIGEATLRQQWSNADEKRSTAEASRNRAVQRMEVFVVEKIFQEINPDHQPDRATFSPTAAVELARRLEQELSESPLEDAHWQQLQSEITQSFTTFMDQLGRHGLHPSLRVIDDSSVSVITCAYQGQPRMIHELATLLEDELASRQRIFEEQERKIIENHLIGEAAAALQSRIREGENWVVRVNEELERVTTSSGIQLKFRWEIADPADQQLLSLRKTFLKTSAAWTPLERDQIGTFLQRRIQEARERDDTATWREHLGHALDYRSWHRFGILRRSPGDADWKRLTKRTFGTGSGGEKAMTLTVPQFAAAAAHYQSAHQHAPRLILLDEVFVAIDAETRERLMGLLETLDLDYVMTSEREWGVYPSVSALSIYQLASRQGYNAVAVTRWIWNGREKLRDPDAHNATSTHG